MVFQFFFPLYLFDALLGEYEGMQLLFVLWRFVWAQFVTLMIDTSEGDENPDSPP